MYNWKLALKICRKCLLARESQLTEILAYPNLSKKKQKESGEKIQQYIFSQRCYHDILHDIFGNQHIGGLIGAGGLIDRIAKKRTAIEY